MQLDFEMSPPIGLWNLKAHTGFHQESVHPLHFFTSLTPYQEVHPPK